MGESKDAEIIRFGVFEVDPRSGELRKSGFRIKLQEQPLRVLLAMLAQPGEVVTREELQRLIWPEESFGDFDHALNVAVGKLRTALNDSPDVPRFIETLPRRGYRFIGTFASSPAVANELPESEERKSATFLPAQTNSKADKHPNRLKIGAAVFFAAACLAGGLFAYQRWRPRAELSALTAIPLTAFPGQEVVPTFSPDGTQVAFAWSGDPASESKGFDLYVKVIGSENLLRLTHHPSEWISPAWSPDGTQIAFHRLSGADTGLYTVPTLGGPERKLRSTHVNNPVTTLINWSPDGKWIAYTDAVAESKENKVNLLSVETLQSNEFAHVANCLSEGLPAFSHDGKQLAYICEGKSPEEDVYIAAIEDGTPKLVARSTGMPTGNAWTRDDSRLIFSMDQGRGGELLELTIANGSLHKLPFGQNAGWPTVSQKGDRLAFVSSTDNINIWRKDLLQPKSAAQKLLASTREQMNPYYSPDGKHIAFESNRGGVPEIWASDADGSNLVQISRLNHYVTGTPRWSPDGEKIVFDTWTSGHPDVYIVDFSELLPRRVVTNVSEMFQPSWSHDGKWIYFLSFAGGTPKIYRCPEKGGNAMVISSEPAFGVHESFDGESVYFVDGWADTRLKKVSVNQAGAASPVDGVPLLKDAGLWTVVPGGIYFVPADAPHAICYFDFSTGKVRRVLDVERDFNPLNGGLSVSPDGRWMLYSQVDDVNSEIQLVEHFR